MKDVKEVKSYIDKNGINTEIVMFEAEQAKTSASVDELKNDTKCELVDVSK